MAAPAEIDPAAEYVRHYVEQHDDGVTTIRTIVEAGDLDADGWSILQPGEKWRGKLASSLREGVYNGHGIFLHGLDAIGGSDAA